MAQALVCAAGRPLALVRARVVYAQPSGWCAQGRREWGVGQPAVLPLACAATLQRFTSFPFSPPHSTLCHLLHLDPLLPLHAVGHCGWQRWPVQLSGVWHLSLSHSHSVPRRAHAVRVCLLQRGAGGLAAGAAAGLRAPSPSWLPGCCRGLWHSHGHPEPSWWACLAGPLEWGWAGRRCQRGRGAGGLL